MVKSGYMFDPYEAVGYNQGLVQVSDFTGKMIYLDKAGKVVWKEK